MFKLSNLHTTRKKNFTENENKYFFVLAFNESRISLKARVYLDFFLTN